MPTQNLGLLNDMVLGDRLEGDDVNKISNTLETVWNQIAGMFGAGVFSADDFVPTQPVNGTLASTLSGGAAIIGEPGYEKPVVVENPQAIPALIDNATNYIYVNQAGTVPVYHGPTRPTNTILVATIQFTAGVGTVDASPDGRRTLGIIVNDASVGAPVATGAVNQEGTSDQLARADHIHGIGQQSVDNATLEVVGGAARIKALGVGAAHIANDAVTDVKLAGDYLFADGARAATADISLGGNQIVNLGAPAANADAATKAYVDGAVSGVTFNDTHLVARDGSRAMTGNLPLATNKITGLGNPTVAQDAATKAYVDTTVAGVTFDDSALVKRDGSRAMTGSLPFATNKITGLGNPTDAQDAATKAYVDAEDATLLKVNGSRALTGDLNLGTHKITNVVNPASAQDAATKDYVDQNAGGLTVVATAVDVSADFKQLLLVDATGANRTITLPATPTSGKAIHVKKTDASYNLVVIAAASPDTIDGTATRTLRRQHQMIQLIGDGTNWRIV